MDVLRIPGEKVKSVCIRLLLNELTELQKKDVYMIQQSAEHLLQLLEELKINEDYLNQLRRERRFDEMGHISHEIRAPLNVMVGYSEMLFEMVESLTDTHQRSISQIIEINTELESTIYELFDKDRQQ